ncbi:MAG: 4Fe-4S dicluster domain-containing protein [Rikenellaceae bacterium]
MAKIKGTIVVDTQRCKGCGVCVTACPLSVLEMSTEVNDKGYTYAVMATAENCTGCASCGIICPDSCIKVYRAKVEE